MIAATATPPLLFDGVDQVLHPTSAGPRPVPSFTRDGRLLGAVFLVALERACAALPAGTEPVSLLGRALVTVVAIDHRHDDLGPHRELAIAVLARSGPIRPPWWRLAAGPAWLDELGLCVVGDAVSAEAAAAAGAEIWGLPRYPATLRFERRHRVQRAVLEGELSLTLRAGPALPTPPLPLPLFTTVGGALVRVFLQTGHRLRWSPGATVRLRVLGDGPTAALARRLGLDARRPLLALRAQAVRGLLPFGYRVAPAHQDAHRRPDSPGPLSDRAKEMDAVANGC